MTPISRTVLAQRLKKLEQSGVGHIEPKPSGKGHLYRLTPASEDFRSIIELLSVWGQRWGQGLLGPDDLDPQELVWSMRRQIDPAEVPAQGFVIRFDFRGLPQSNRGADVASEKSGMPAFQLLDLLGDECLRTPAFACRRREAAGPEHLDESRHARHPIHAPPAIYHASSLII